MEGLAIDTITEDERCEVAEIMAAVDYFGLKAVQKNFALAKQFVEVRKDD